jgi:hypothetical protein
VAGDLTPEPPDHDPEEGHTMNDTTTHDDVLEPAQAPSRTVTLRPAPGVVVRGPKIRETFADGTTITYYPDGVEVEA